MAEFGLEYLFFKSLIASFIELMSELVISERSFFVIGLPFRYRTASIFVTRSISDIGLLFRSDWMIFITEISLNLPYIYSDALRNNLYVSFWVSSQYLYPRILTKLFHSKISYLLIKTPITIFPTSAP